MGISRLSASPIRSVTKRPSLFPTSSTPCSIPLPCGRDTALLAGSMGLTQLTTGEMQSSEVGACSPVERRMSLVAGRSTSLSTYHFGHSVSASCRCFFFTRFISSSLSFNRLVFPWPLAALRLAAFGTLFLRLQTSALAFACSGRDTWTLQGLRYEISFTT